MDELDLLNDFRSNVTTDDVALRRARRELLDQAAGATPTVAGRPRRRTRFLLVAGVAAVIGGLTAGALVTTSGGSDAPSVAAGATSAAPVPPTPGPASTAPDTKSVSGVLNLAATAVEREAPAAAPRDGQFLYRREIGGQSAATGNIGTGPASHLCRSVHELWIPASGQGNVQVSRVDGIVPAAAYTDPRTLPRDPRCHYAEFESPGSDAGIGLTREDAAALPTDAVALYQWARAKAKEVRTGPKAGLLDDETFIVLADLARSNSPWVKPAQLAAVYRALARVPGAKLLGAGKNLLGRPGVVVGRTEKLRGERTEIVFDPNTGAVLGYRSVSTSTSSGTPPGTVTWASVITTATVDAVGQRPTR